MKSKNNEPDDRLQFFGGLLPDFVSSILCLAFSMEVAYGEKQK